MSNAQSCGCCVTCSALSLSVVHGHGPTFGFISAIRIGLSSFSMSYSCWKVLFWAIFTILFISSLFSGHGVVDVSSCPYFDNLSAISLPSMPTCPLTSCRVSLKSISSRMLFIPIIWLTSVWWLVFDQWFSVSSDDIESVSITTSLFSRIAEFSAIHSAAFFIANSSADIIGNISPGSNFHFSL